MMEEVSRICDQYGLDVWIWYPAMDRDYSDPKTVAFALKQWEEVYRRLPRIDYIFVPGGDPGNTEPKILFALLEKADGAAAQVSFAGADVDVAAELQQGLDGGVLRADAGAAEMAERHRIWPAVARRPSRNGCPHSQELSDPALSDITHSTQAQYAVPDWDVAYAVTEGREGPNPRPTQERAIFRKYMQYAVGFLSYSEGVNDDVNKFVWSGLAWDPDQPVIEILREFSRYFIGEQYRDMFAQGLLGLERNWVGPLLANEGVETTLQTFRDMEKHASSQVKLNWRFQQALYRAYYDSYVRDRLIYETSLEQQAMDKLRTAERTGSVVAIEHAEAVIDRAVTEPVSPDKRQRIFELAEALYQSIHAQLSVRKYQALALGRGSDLDIVDAPVNNRV